MMVAGPKNLLTIAGSDSGGGAGIQADLKTFQSLGAYGLSAITALTSQNTRGVDGVDAPAADFVAQQMRAVISDIRVDAVKTGMLHNTETVRAVASTWVEMYPNAAMRPPLVVDPVMVSTSGHELLEPSAEAALIEDLLPLAALVTPNLPEAAILAGWKESKRAIKTEQDMQDAARAIASRGAGNVLVKGGHAKGDDAILNVLYESKADRFTVLMHQRIRTPNDHGTGCTLSAAIATFLAQGMTIPNAVKAATDYVQNAMQSSFNIGSGAGPLNHGHTIITRTLPLPNPHRPFPFTDHLIEECRDLWTIYTQTHPFIRQLADGTLPSESFTHFLRQDYIFLKHYARIHALAAYKCDTIAEIDATTDIVKHITREAGLHIDRCKDWQISEEDFHNTVESNHTVAYTRYVIDVGLAKSLLHLRVATAPCLLGYGAVGLLLYNDPATKREGNPYWPWICEYAGDDFQQAVRTGRDLLEKVVMEDPLGPKGLAEMVDIFRNAVKLEIGFWQMGIDKS